MTKAELETILQDEWTKHRPPISMGERRIALAVAAMRRAYEAGREDAEAEIDAKFQLVER